MELTDHNAGTAVSVILVYEDEDCREHVRQALAEQPVKVVEEVRLSEAEPDALEHGDGQTVLVNLDGSVANLLDRLAGLLRGQTRPVVFNDAEFTRGLSGWDQARWSRHLVAKISGRVDVYPPAPMTKEPAQVMSDHSEQAATEADAAKTVWVLGASIGGPEAVRAFLDHLPGHVPAGFILAQHMGAEFLDLLAEQLDKACDLEVTCAVDGEAIREGQVVVAPVEASLTFSDQGKISLLPEPPAAPYRPSIDHVLEMVAEHYGERCGAIIFSGMASDGIAGCRAVAGHGGTVWAQDAESCVISSMADGARSAGVVDFSGTPASLARRLVERLYGFPVAPEDDGSADS